MILIVKRDSKDYEEEMKNWISRLDSLIIGPGLGRSENAYNYVRHALNIAKPLKIPIVIDADGLFFVAK